MTAAISQHERIREELLRIVRSRQSEGPGTRLFTEHEIANEYGVHRLTARQAIQSLVNDGLVYRLRGRGTFLAASKLAEPLDRITYFKEEWSSQGHGAESRLLHRAVVPNPRHLPTLHADKVLHFVRLRLVDRVPVALDYRWTLFELRDVFTDERLAHESIQQILSSAQGARWSGTNIEIEAVAAGATEANHLKTLVGTPLLLSRVAEMAETGPLVVGHSFHRPDLFKYRISLPS